MGSKTPFFRGHFGGGVDTLLDNLHFWTPQKGGPKWGPKMGSILDPFLDHFWPLFLDTIIGYSASNDFNIGVPPGPHFWANYGPQKGSLLGSPWKSRILWVFKKLEGSGHSGPPFFTFFHFLTKIGWFSLNAYFLRPILFKNGPKTGNFGSKMGSKNHPFFSFFNTCFRSHWAKKWG